MVQQGNKWYCKGVSASWNSGPVNRATHHHPALVLDNLICESSSNMHHQSGSGGTMHPRFNFTRFLQTIVIEQIYHFDMCTHHIAEMYTSYPLLNALGSSLFACNSSNTIAE